MIYLNANTVNQFIVTVRERSQIYQSGGTPYYLVELHNQSTSENRYVIAQTVVSNPRFDLLQLTISGTGESLSASTINLPELTTYEYSIYEQESNSNLDVNQTTGRILEQGLMQLDKINNAETQFNNEYRFGVNNNE